MPEGDLVSRKLGWAAKADASFLGGLAPGAGPLMNERPLELRDSGEHGQDHPAGRRGGVGPGLGQRAQARADPIEDFGLCCKFLVWAVDLRFLVWSGCDFEMLIEPFDGFGKGGGSDAESPLDQAHLSPDPGLNTPGTSLSLAQCAHQFEPFDRGIGCGQ